MTAPDTAHVNSAITAYAGTRTGMLRIRGHLKLNPGQLLADQCNRADAHMLIHGVELHRLRAREESLRGRAPRMLVSRDSLELCWGDDPAGGGLALTDHPVRLITANVEVDGVLRIPEGSSPAVNFADGRTRFVEVHRAHIFASDLTEAEQDLEHPVCLVNRSKVLGLIEDPPARASARSGAMPVLRLCLQEGCGRPAQVTCEYTDSSAAACDSHWCSEHVVAVGSGRYCRRHREVALALEATAGSIHELPRPAVNDRMLSLLQHLFRDLDAGVAEILRAAPVNGGEVVADSNPRMLLDHGRPCWERGWGLATSHGYAARVSVRCQIGDPPEVRILVGRVEVFAGAPAWIAQRPADPAATAAARERFAAGVHQQITARIAASTAPAPSAI